MANTDKRSNVAKHTADMMLAAQVFESGSITAACKTTGLERTTLSRRLGALEKRVGIALFDRTGNRIAPTNAGNTFLSYCFRISELVDELDSIMQGTANSESRVLCVKADFDDALQLLAPIVRRFLDQHKDTDVAFTQVQQPLGDLPDDADLVIQINGRRQPGTQVHELSTLPRSIWGASELISSTEYGNDPRSLRRFTFLGVSDATDGVTSWNLSNGEFSIDFPVVERLRFATQVGCREACIAGHGIAILPDFLCKLEEQNGTLVRVLPEWSPSNLRLTAAHHRSLRMTGRLYSLIEFFKAHCTET